jgi:hypothetical protein
MAKVLKIIGGAAIAVGVAYGAAKGYAYWRVKGQLDELARLANPYAELRWKGISTELSGAVEVSGVTIAPRAIAQDVEIASVRIETGNPGLLFTGLPRRADQAPERMRLAVTGVQIPLRGALLDGLQRDAKANACEFGGMPDAALLAAAGMEKLVIDFGMDFSMPKDAGRLDMRFQYATRGVDALEAEAAFSGAGPMPAFKQALVRYRPNAEAVARIADHCAQRRGLDRAGFLRALAEQSGRLFAAQFGVAPGPGLSEAIRAYLVRPGEIKLAIRPEGEVSPTMFAAGAERSLADWQRLAGLELYLNGALVEDLRTVPTEQAALVPGGAPATEGGRTAAAGASPAKASFQDRPVEEIGRYLDHRVRVHTRDGKAPREGRLDSVDATQANVDQRMFGGHLISHVRLDQIARLEVMLR